MRRDWAQFSTGLCHFEQSFRDWRVSHIGATGVLIIGIDHTCLIWAKVDGVEPKTTLTLK